MRRFIAWLGMLLLAGLPAVASAWTIEAGDLVRVGSRSSLTTNGPYLAADVPLNGWLSAGLEASTARLVGSGRLVSIPEETRTLDPSWLSTLAVRMRAEASLNRHASLFAALRGGGAFTRPGDLHITNHFYGPLYATVHRSPTLAALSGGDVGLRVRPSRPWPGVAAALGWTTIGRFDGSFTDARVALFY